MLKDIDQREIVEAVNDEFVDNMVVDDETLTDEEVKNSCFG